VHDIHGAYDVSEATRNHVAEFVKDGIGVAHGMNGDIAEGHGGVGSGSADGSGVADDAAGNASNLMMEGANGDTGAAHDVDGDMNPACSRDNSWGVEGRGRGDETTAAARHHEACSTKVGIGLAQHADGGIGVAPETEAAAV